MGEPDMRMVVGCVRCGAAIDVSPGPDMPEDGSGYRVWHCRCGMVYDLGRQDGQAYIFVRPESVDDDDEEWGGAADG
jgi:hypothetical protein